MDFTDLLNHLHKKTGNRYKVERDDYGNVRLVNIYITHAPATNFVTEQALKNYLTDKIDNLKR